MRAYEFLLEYRRNNTPKQNAFEVLKQYKDRDDIYISFTKLDKLGLNPKTQWATPIGIYSYPLKAAWDYYDIGRKQFGGFPWAASEPYIWVFEADIKDLTQLTEQDYNNAVDYIFANNIMSEMALDNYINSENTEIYKRNNKWGPLIWDMTRKATVRQKTDSEKGYYNVNKWSKLLLDLGYNGLSDKHGNSIIHSNEPCQAVFFTTKGIKIVEKIYNNRPLRKEQGVKIAAKKKLVNSLSDDEFIYKLKHGGIEADELIIDSDEMVLYKKNPTPDLQWGIYNFSPRFAARIKNLIPEIQEKVVKIDGTHIKFFPNADAKIQIAAIEFGGFDSIKLIKNIKPETIKYIIDNDPMLIEYVQIIPPEIQMYALNTNINLYKKIKNPCGLATNYYNEHKGTP
jgi:hypothetical protein